MKSVAYELVCILGEMQHFGPHNPLCDAFDVLEELVDPIADQLEFYLEIDRLIDIKKELLK